MATIRSMAPPNGPGWTLEQGRFSYWVWAPRAAIDFGVTVGGAAVTATARDYWAACWQRSDDEDAGDYLRAVTLADAVAVFPSDPIRRRFIQHIQSEWATTHAPTTESGDEL